MKLLFVVLVALLARAAASDEVSDPDVVVLTASNFDAIVNPEDLILVEFYAPWCGHCKHLAPEYAKAATTLLRNDPPIKLAKVDATQEQSLASKHNVNGYPTLKLFRNGQPTDYNGPREATGIVNYMKKQVGPSTTEVKTIEQAEKVFGNEDEVVIAGFFTSQGTEYKEFRKVADALRDKLKFAHTLDSAVLDKFQYRQAIVLFKPYDERRVTFGGSFSQSAITEWIFKHQLPIAGALTKSNMEFYNRRGLPILKVLIDVDFEHNKKQMDYYLNRLRKVAKEFPEISYTIAEKSQFAEDRDRFALTGKEASAVLIEEISGQRKFKSPLEKFSVENVRQFVSDYSEGKLKPFIKSEPVPEPAKAGEVAVVVGETFNDIVLDTSKDVLIEFYAPWCGHCKSLAPKYEQLAKEFKDVESVVIAKIDATANDWAQSAYRASGYPTIYFAPANNKENPIKYDGEREVAAMKKWIKEKASIKIKGKK